MIFFCEYTNVSKCSCVNKIKFNFHLKNGLKANRIESTRIESTPIRKHYKSN